MNYGKSIMPGRLSKLPASLLTLFSNVITEENKLVEKEY